MSYWMAFSNSGRRVKRGDRVNVVIGHFMLTDSWWNSAHFPAFCTNVGRRNIDVEQRLEVELALPL